MADTLKPIRKFRLFLWLGTLFLGGFSAFLAYVGSTFIKACVLISTLMAVWLTKRVPVYPFGQLFYFCRDRPPLTEPDVLSSARLLEQQKRRSLPLVCFMWLLVLGGSSMAGFFFPSKLTSTLSKIGHVSRQLGDWPKIQTIFDHIFAAAFVATVCVPATAYVLWLSFHLLASAKDKDHGIRN
jgi:hypothetical protein